MVPISISENHRVNSYNPLFLLDGPFVVVDTKLLIDLHITCPSIFPGFRDFQ